MSVQQTAGSDPYFPANGDPRYRVHRYELAPDYRPGPNRLSGTARLNAIAGRAPLAEFQLNLADFRIGRVRVDGKAPHYTHRGGRLRIRPPKAIRAGAAFTVEVHWSGNAKPVNSAWGGLRWEELEDGALVASQPVGAPSWYPCNDRPADKASYQLSVTTSGGRTAQQLATLAHRKLSSLPQDLRLADPGRKLMFDDRLYERGGLALHAVRCALGDEAFFRMLRGWAGVRRGGVVTTTAFTTHAARFSAQPLDELFTAWLEETALPSLPVLAAPVPARPPYPPHIAGSA
ncbi:gluzincin family metallopeptidase [Streptomyces avermitilis]|uniref:hypothetical protein n=1 Tax=Streptomyces avermitilis TaxID=33903 RepID=UPI0036CC839A